jgi:hypothetical protein
MKTRDEVQGTLHEDGTLVLDQKPDLPPGRGRLFAKFSPQMNADERR